METKRQLDVLDRHLAENEYFAGAEYSIADMAIWPWYGVLSQGKLYEAAKFLDVESYTNLRRWTEQIAQRPAVVRGRIVNRAWGEDNEKCPERHSAADIDAALKA
jgi:GST-like protein